MPIYEYACATCGKAFDYLARTLSDKPEKCPSCGAKKISKQLSAFAKPAPMARGGCGSCPSEAACPAASASGCGCAGACSHG
jgi:putative FmdB family regulatory protein